MAGVQQFSEKVIDYAERLSDVADAVQGKTRRSGGGWTRWVLPASGAGLLALMRSDFFARQAKSILDEAKTRASDLPDDLLGAVRQTGGSGSKEGGQRSSSRSSNGTSSRSPARKNRSAGKRTSASR